MSTKISLYVGSQQELKQAASIKLATPKGLGAGLEQAA